MNATAQISRTLPWHHPRHLFIRWCLPQPFTLMARPALQTRTCCAFRTIPILYGIDTTRVNSFDHTPSEVLPQRPQHRRLIHQQRLQSHRRSNHRYAEQQPHQQQQSTLWKRSRRSFTKVSSLSLTSKKRHGHKITMVTAYDYPSGIHVARAGIDVILVGDSVAMVELGHATTQPLTLDGMLHHCAAVKRGVDYAISTGKNPLSTLDGPDSSSSSSSSSSSLPQTVQIPLLVGDMPFGSYEFEDTDIALHNAYRFIKEGGMDAVKVEGGSVARSRTARRIVEGGIAVMGHVGLTPQAISVIGGFRAQGRTAIRARAVLDEALRLQDAGVFAVVVECIPANVAAAITETLEIPTIGIGAGGYTSGQVLVYHDMLGMSSHPHHEQFVPRFCKRYAQIGHLIQRGLQEYKLDVESGTFPSNSFSPYLMVDEEREAFDELLAKDADYRRRKHSEAAEKYVQSDEYEKLHLYGDDGNLIEKPKN